MAQVGILCPNTPGHINPMLALAEAIGQRGHRAHFFLLGDPPPALIAAGLPVHGLGGSVFPTTDYQAAIEQLGFLTGRAALRHTAALGARAAEATLQVGPAVVGSAGVSSLIVDQASFAGGTIADRLGMPFVTVCNALLLDSEPGVPPFFTSWLPRDAGWARVRNRVAWAALQRVYEPILRQIRAARQRHGLPGPRRAADTWSKRLQVSQQPAAFEFPRLELPVSCRFVGPLRRVGGDPSVAFPWDQLDGRPLIYASLGTLQNRLTESFRTIATACAGLDAQLVITTGRGLDPTALGKLPGDPMVVSYAPQGELLARAVLAVTHAGLNTVLDALSRGVPMVALPVTNEQPGVAARVAWSGAGVTLRPQRATPPTLRAAIQRVLTDPSYRQAADRIGASIAAEGGATRAADWIETALELAV